MANSFIGRKPNDVANWMDRFKAIRNGQVPSVAAVTFIILSQGWYKFEEDNKGDK